MATIQEFYTAAASRDFARLFQFRLTTFANILFNPEDYAYVESASLPGRSITNVPVPYMGLSFNLPGTVTYPGSTGYQVTFRCDANYDLRAALEAATFNTFDEATSTGQYGLPGGASIIQLELLNKGGADGVIKPVRVYTLYGAYVQSLADTAYTVTDTGTVATIQATLAYQFWRAGKEKVSSIRQNQEALIDNGQILAEAIFEER
jgi:hypothetical protein